MELKKGQIYTYKTRPGEENSTATIVELTSLDNEIVIVHLKVDGLLIIDKTTKEVIATTILHLPVSFESFVKSIISLVGYTSVEENEGYIYWLDLYAKGKSGAWSVEIADAIDMTESSYNTN